MRSESVKGGDVRSASRAFSSVLSISGDAGILGMMRTLARFASSSWA